MAKSKTVWVCQNCGAESPKWIGRCPVCGEWNTYVEEIITKPSGKKPGASMRSSGPPRPLASVESVAHRRIITGTGEFNRILGGGIVPGTLVLLGGEPGIGKSTLALQACLQLASFTLYVSGEESAEQIKLRANRMGLPQDHTLIYPETRYEFIADQIRKISPSLVVGDSRDSFTS